MTRRDKIAELAQFIMSRDPALKNFGDVDYQLHKNDLEDEIHRSIESWLDGNARGE